MLSPPRYAFRVQNTVEAWLFASTTVLIVLGCLYSSLIDAGVVSGVRIVCEVLMLVVLIGSFAGTAVYLVQQMRSMRMILMEADLATVLLTADDQIDARLRRRLGDGTIRLLRCSWLLSPDADACLGRDAVSAAPIMRSHQELIRAAGDDAFFSPEEAVALLDRRNRSILVLSYRWLTAVHPEPTGTTTDAVRRFLQTMTSDDIARCGLFWDFVSIPQKPRNGSGEQERFDAALGVMGCLYASMTATTVLQLRRIPPRPAAYDGRVTLVVNGNLTDESVCAQLEKHLGGVVSVQTLASDNPEARGRRVRVHFATHEAAERCVATYKAALEYNSTSYARDVRESAEAAYSGWCTFEQGVCLMVVAHMQAAEAQAAARGTVLPERFANAQATRQKAIDISEIGDGCVRPRRVPSETPEELLTTTLTDLEDAAFVGRGEFRRVQQMLSELEWIIKTALERATLQYAESGLTVAPADMRLLRLRHNNKLAMLSVGIDASTDDSLLSTEQRAAASHNSSRLSPLELEGHQGNV